MHGLWQTSLRFPPWTIECSAWVDLHSTQCKLQLYSQGYDQEYMVVARGSIYISLQHVVLGLPGVPARCGGGTGLLIRTLID